MQKRKVGVHLKNEACKHLLNLMHVTDGQRTEKAMMVFQLEQLVKVMQADIQFLEEGQGMYDLYLKQVIMVFQLVQPLNLVRVMQACIHSLMAGQMMDDLRKAQVKMTFRLLQLVSLVMVMQAGICFLKVV